MTGEQAERPARFLTGAAWTVVALLAEGSYEAAANLASGSLTASDLEREVQRLEGPLVDPPPVDHVRLHLTELPGGGYVVSVPLWTSSAPPSTAVDLRVTWTPYDTVECALLRFRPVDEAEALASKQGPHPRQTPPAKRGVPVGHSATSQLDADELAAIHELVSALVARDYRRLEHLVDEGCRPDDLEDLYRWTKRWRYWDEVTLVMPPGAPETWTISSDGAYADTDGRQVLVAMWTAEEGFSDLTLEVRLTRDSRGDVSAWMRELHAM